MGGVFLRSRFRMALSGALAGIVNGLLGTGGGMVLVPMLQKFNRIPEESVFPASVSVILPICAVTAILSISSGDVNVGRALPYLIGSALGGIGVSLLGKKIPTLWLHRIFGALLLWGGIRYLC